MLDHRIAEHHIEALVRKAGQIRGISGYGFDIPVPLLLREEVQRGDLKFFAAGPATSLPESIRPAHVKDCKRTGHFRNERLKQLESALAKPVRQRVCIFVVGEPTDHWKRSWHGCASFRNDSAALSR